MTHPAQVKFHGTEPGRRLLDAIRAAFIARGTSLSRWCEENEIHPQNARAAITGAWGGPKGSELRKRIVNASGLVHAE